MKHRIRYTAWSIALCLLLTTLFSCGNNNTPTETTDTPDTTASVIVTETQTDDSATTEIVTDVITEPSAPVTQPAETETTSKAPAAVIEPTVVPDIYLDPLTGTAVSKEEAERRPVAIMLNNVTAALPQQNIGAADILYECQVEGYLTRLMGVFNDYEDLDAIGSIRSSREYYLDFAANHNAIYIHAGGSEEAYRNLKARGTNNLDAVNDYTVSGFFYRDPNRLGKMSFEHTLVIDGDQINKAIASKGYRTTYADSFDNPLNFVDEGQRVNLTDGTAAKQLTVKFGAHTTALVYDASQNRYLRWQTGEKHVDGVTGKQLGYENVIVLFCPYTLTKDDYNHIEVATTGKGTGYYLTGGKKIDIQWSKSSGDEPIKFCLKNGKELSLTPGKTNIEIVGYESAVTILAE